MRQSLVAAAVASALPLILRAIPFASPHGQRDTSMHTDSSQPPSTCPLRRTHSLNLLLGISSISSYSCFVRLMPKLVPGRHRRLLFHALSILRTASSLSSSHCPSQGHMGGLYSGSPVTRGRPRCMRRLSIVSGRRSASISASRSSKARRLFASRVRSCHSSFASRSKSTASLFDERTC